MWVSGGIYAAIFNTPICVTRACARGVTQFLTVTSESICRPRLVMLLHLQFIFQHLACRNFIYQLRATRSVCSPTYDVEKLLRGLKYSVHSGIYKLGHVNLCAFTTYHPWQSILHLILSSNVTDLFLFRRISNHDLRYLSNIAPGATQHVLRRTIHRYMLRQLMRTDSQGF